MVEFISHCIKNKKVHFGNRAMLGVLCIIVAFALLGWIYLSQASQMTMTSRHVKNMEREIERLQEQNLQLMAQIAHHESVTELADRAKAMGFASISPGEVEFLVVAPQKEPSQAVANRAPSENLWSQVTTQFISWAQSQSESP